MRKRHLWWAAAGLAIAYWTCNRGGAERIEVAVHLKLAPGAGDRGDDRLGVDVAAIEPLFARSAGLLAIDRAQAAARSGRAAPDLSAWRRIELRGSRAAIDRAIARL